MKLILTAMGNRMPAWVTAGYQDYAKRFPANCALLLKEIPLGKRPKQADITRLIHKESKQMQQAIPAGNHVVALDVTGAAWSTSQLAQQFSCWRESGRDVSFLIGGPEGLHPHCLAKAQQTWSLSPLTLPHPLVRIIVAEQLYRAHSLLHNHPYHRSGSPR